MQNLNSDRKQPAHSQTSEPQSGRILQPAVKPSKRRKGGFWLWVVLFFSLLGFSVIAGALAGYKSGSQAQKAAGVELAKISLQEQYDLGVQDLAAGRYEVARQRFEYIVAHDPSFPGITEKLAEAMTVLYATATPTPPAATGTPTPTRDLRPVEDLFKQALDLFAGQKWTEAIDTLVALRKSDPAFQVARVDGLLFISLRQRGVDKIWKEGNLEGGSYDLALAERFGPLDAQAVSSRELARLYMIGSSFWEVYPEQAVNYFSQVAASAPGLQDASGWTASERYRESLIQYGNQLAAKQDWCNAQRQYEIALSLRPDANLEATTRDVATKCSPPTSTIPSTTDTPTATIPSDLSPTPTQPLVSTATNTLPVIPPTETPTPPIVPTTEAPPPPTDTIPPPPPTDTPVTPPPEPAAIPTTEGAV